MTAELFGLFVAALPREARGYLRRTETAQRDLVRALREGWSLPALAAYVTSDSAAARDLGALMAARLKDASVTPASAGAAMGSGVHGDTSTPAEARLPPALAARGWSQPRLPCGACDGTESRWLEMPDGRLMHCPVCWERPPGYADPPAPPARAEGVPMPETLRAAVRDATRRKDRPA